jgi:hypothetical protein
MSENPFSAESETSGGVQRSGSDFPTLTDGPSIADMAKLLDTLSTALSEQGNFHMDSHVAFGIQNIKEAAAIASRRAGMAAASGPHHRRAMQQTVLLELTRATLISGTALGNADREAWPDLETAVALARDAIRAAIAHDPRLMSDPSPTAAVGDEHGSGWMEADGRFFWRTDEGVVLSVALMALPDSSTRWSACFGRVNVSLHGSRDDAFGAALGAQAFLYAAAPIIAFRP